jgi:Cu(I)/Ag(I) efflux system periplasmic protein CusF
MQPKRYARVFRLAASLLIFTGCAAAYTPPPLTTLHPAHPEAAAAPEPPRSTTLAYGPADLPQSQPERAMAQHGGHGAHTSHPQSRPSVTGEGTVTAVVPERHQIVVDHGEIKGFMGAMTMGYRAEPPSLLEGLQAGDRIRFTIDPSQQTIVNIEKLKP